MVYFTENTINKWMRTGGTPMTWETSFVAVMRAMGYGHPNIIGTLQLMTILFASFSWWYDHPAISLIQLLTLALVMACLNIMGKNGKPWKSIGYYLVN
jgi:hypothetical protein